MEKIDFSLLERLGKQIDKGGEPPDDGVMNLRLTALETRLDTILPTLATKTDIGELRIDMHKMNADIKTWTLATMITIIGAMLAAIFGISQIFKASTVSPASPPAQPTPFIFYLQPAPVAAQAAPLAPQAPPAKKP